MKEANTTAAANHHNDSNLSIAPKRKVMDAVAAQRAAARCSDYNTSRSEAHNFNYLEFNGVKFQGEDFSGVENHFSKYVDCEFIECTFSRMEAHFAEFSNCTFTNSCLENADFSFSQITDTRFFNCNLNGADFSFAQGSFSCTGGMMKRIIANNSNLHLSLSRCNAAGFEANCANIALDITGSSLRRSEFNDSTVSGKIVQSDVTDGEFNRAALAELEILDCAVHNMETEDASGIDLCDNAFEDIFNEQEDGSAE